MKKDTEVKLYMTIRAKGKSQKLAAAQAGMSERTARKYERKAKLPSELTQPRTHRTRANPFALDWDWVCSELARDPALQATTLFALLCAKNPDRYRPTQIRTLQRQIAAWRASFGPDKEVIFEQVALPARQAQSDFTNMNDLGVTLGGLAFPHQFYHFVLVYSKVEAVKLCRSESFEALAEGLEKALWQIGGVPTEHRTDHLSAAVLKATTEGSNRQDFTQRYTALLAHYGLTPTYNNLGKSHENGSVEQSHFRFKQAVDQALRVRGSRDFTSQSEYESFVYELVRLRNLTRKDRFEVERATLQPLPLTSLNPSRELSVVVSRFSTITVLTNTYSVPARLIGSTVLVRVRSETLEIYLGTTKLLSLPRLVGKQKVALNYRHIIWSLVRKPGAFAQYRFREELFPSLAFRRAYDQLVLATGHKADSEYLRILHLAATTSETEVETALKLLAESQTSLSFEAVRELVCVVPAAIRPKSELGAEVNLGQYDQLLPTLVGVEVANGN